MPDISFGMMGCDFWMEVKYCKTAPTRLSQIDHYTQGQREWLVMRGLTGAGFCFLLIGLPGCELLLDSATLKEVHDLPLSMAMMHGKVLRDLPHVVDHLVWLTND